MGHLFSTHLHNFPLTTDGSGQASFAGGRVKGARVPDRQGVTLLELLVVLVILAFGAALAVPSIGSGLESLRARAAIRRIMAMCREARVHALSTKIPYDVFFDLDVGSYGFRPQPSPQGAAGEDEIAAGAAGETPPADAGTPSQAPPTELSAHPGSEDGAAMMPGATRTLPEKRQPIPSAIEFTRIAEGSQSVLTFYPKGSSSGGKIELKNARGQAFVISIDRLSGRVRLHKAGEEPS